MQAPVSVRVVARGVRDRVHLIANACRATIQDSVCTSSKGNKKGETEKVNIKRDNAKKCVKVLNRERLQEYEMSCLKKWTGRSDKAYCTETMPPAKRDLFVVPAQHVHRNDLAHSFCGMWQQFLSICRVYIGRGEVASIGDVVLQKMDRKHTRRIALKRMPPAKCVLLVVTAPRQVDKVPLPLFFHSFIRQYFVKKDY